MVSGYTKSENGKNKFIPTTKKHSGVTRKIIIKNSPIFKINNASILEKKKQNLITKEKAQTLSDSDLDKTIDFVTDIFEIQTQKLEKSDGKFDESMSRDQHEKTFHTMNMLIEIKKMRKEGGKNMTNIRKI